MDVDVTSTETNGEAGSGPKLTLSEAQEEFKSILRRMVDDENCQNFLGWIQWNCQNTSENPDKDEPEDVLKSIADDIRGILPTDAIMPSEKILIPTVGPNADCDPNRTVHVDAFLLDDDMVEALCEKGAIPRNYCLECGSNKTKPYHHISHSASRERIGCIFSVLLPPIEHKTVLDIGSRLGCMLYGAFLYTKAEKIIGIEMNGDLCKIQREIVKKYNFQERIEVIEDNVLNRPDVVQAADVVIMNNVFEFFLTVQQQMEVWTFVRQTLRKGTILVCIPSLEETLLDFPSQNNMNVAEWVKEVPPYNSAAPVNPYFYDELVNIKQYIVL